jgi:hypothetical protein
MCPQSTLKAFQRLGPQCSGTITVSVSREREAHGLVHLAGGQMWDPRSVVPWETNTPVTRNLQSRRNGIKTVDGNFLQRRIDDVTYETSEVVGKEINCVK